MKQEIKYITYNTLEYAYFPFTEKKDVKINKDLYVFCNDVITIFNNKNIYSTISGSATNTIEINSTSGKLKTVIVKNDYKDKKSKTNFIKKSINDYKTNELKTILKNNNINIKPKKTLILNVEFKHQLIEKSMIYLNQRIEDILNTLDIISYNYHIEKTLICLDKKDNNSFDTLLNFIGTYPHIEVTFTNIDKLTKKINESNIFNVREIIEINNVLKNKISEKETVLTIVNSSEITNVSVRKYVSLKELLKEMKIQTNKVTIVTKESFIIEDLNFLITDDINAIII